MGVGSSADPAVSTCLNALHARAPYTRVRIWVVHDTVVCSCYPVAHGVGQDVPPPRASLGLTPWSAATAAPPVAPAVAYCAASVVHTQSSSSH